MRDYKLALCRMRLSRFFNAGLTIVLMAALEACHVPSRAPAGLPGDPERGRTLLVQYGCAHCHAIPGIVAAGGVFGPPLDKIAKRVYLAGALTNSPQHMSDWIRTPSAFKPMTAMPDLHVSEADARDMVAYLYRLR